MSKNILIKKIQCLFYFRKKTQPAYTLHILYIYFTYTLQILYIFQFVMIYILYVVYMFGYL